MASLFILSFLLGVTSIVAVPAFIDEPDVDVITDAYRLPRIYTIKNYELELYVPHEVFWSNSTEYGGTVIITLSFLNETEEIKLHASATHITLRNVSFNNIMLDTSDYSVNSETDILTIKLPNSISLKRDYKVVIEYDSHLNTQDMHGFYKSSYVNDRNVTIYLATTQFEPTHARKAFPCFDEPNFKATFNVTISHPTNLTAFFNTPELGSSTNKTLNITSTTFEVTPIMSTYLLAFIVSDFNCTSGNVTDGVSFRVCSRPNAEHTRKRAVEVGSKVIDRLNEFTGYNYSINMKKMDQVAIPDFSAGAMENWGLVTYREAALLWDENESSNEYNQRVTTVIAHEFAHQWFGDLVTCDWWSVLFLNEGFATYFEYHIANEVVTADWELDKQFLVDEVHTALYADASEKAQALQSAVSTPAQIDDKFGTISYNKGGSVLRMVAHVMGLENFKAGLQAYLTNNKFTSVVPVDLWDVLDDFLNDTVLPTETLGDAMENWIIKSGFPLVTATLENDTVVVTQERFLLSGTDNETKWYVPISYTTSEDEDKFNNTMPSVWLTPEEDSIIPYSNETNWIILNNQQTGYYRVNYDDTLWNKIKAALESKSFGGIGDLNRAQIMDDLFNLARAGKVKYSLALNIANYLREETSYYPWDAAFTGYSFLLRRVGQNNLGKAISSSLLQLLEKLSKSVPMTDLKPDNQIYTINQINALDWACKLGNEECVKEASELFKNYKNSGKRPDRNLRSVVYCNALRYSKDASDWEFLWKAYLNASRLATEQVTILSALGCTKDTNLLKAYLTKTITNDSGIRTQDTSSAYSAVYTGNPEGIAVAFNFLTENFEKIAGKYQTLNSLENIIRGIAERFTTEAEVNNLDNFIKTGNLPEGFVTAAKEALETARANVKWTQQFEKDLRNFYGVSGVGRMGASLMVTLIAVLVSKLCIY